MIDGVPDDEHNIIAYRPTSHPTANNSSKFYELKVFTNIECTLNVQEQVDFM